MIRAVSFIVAAAMVVACHAQDKTQVFLLMGQSNMLGEGKIGPDNVNGSLGFAVKTEHKYEYLWDAKNNSWAVRDDVRYVFTMGSGNATFAKSQLLHNEWMTVTGKTIGPELGIGNFVGNFSKPKVMILKGCIGNRALGWDLLPPGSEEWDYTDSKGNQWTYAGYHDSPEKWAKGTKPKPMGWFAGEQYDGDTERMSFILSNFSAYMPEEKDYEIAGFFWWQGDRDRYDGGLAERYETNLVQLIKTLRKQYNAPSAKFVIASLGQTPMGATGTEGMILQAMLNVANGTLYPQFEGNVGTVYSHPLSMGGSSASHYGGNAETYMNIGEAMGDKMVNLMKADEKYARYYH
ncbi:uncharacterized protein LOC135810063 [Sycon ciliatum]|uniref:uncharacterized protein LOC135810063 n=1 Tax=Sycon ciliatum TaxID=27933 RepID=UPI0020AE1D74|eukprot:scpid66623/ scgid16680/ 